MKLGYFKLLLSRRCAFDTSLKCSRAICTGCPLVAKVMERNTDLANKVNAS